MPTNPLAEIEKLNILVAAQERRVSAARTSLDAAKSELEGATTAFNVANQKLTEAILRHRASVV